MLLTIWLEFRDTSIRTEADAEAVLGLPLLVAVPWVGTPLPGNHGNGKFKFWNRNKSPDERREKVGV
jgi:hypothetical protein